MVYEAPLLVETGAYRGLAALVVVSTSPDIQLARLLVRDQLSESAAQARLAAQAPLDAKLAVADYVVTNDAGQAELREQGALSCTAHCARALPPNTQQTHLTLDPNILS